MYSFLSLNVHVYEAKPELKCKKKSSNVNHANFFQNYLLLFLARLYKSTGRAIAVTTASASTSALALAALLKMLKLLVKVFKTLYLLNP